MANPLCRCYQVRYLSGERGSRKGFIGELLENIRQELNKNKDMKDNIKKFREEAKKLEESDALKQARRKYKTIESETAKTSDVLKKKLGNISETVKEVNVTSISLSLSFDCHPIDTIFELIYPPLQCVCVCVCVCGQGLEEVGRTEIGKKIKDGMEEAAKTAKTSAESVSKGGEMLGKSGAFRAISQGMESVKQEIGDLGHTGPYRSPARLRKRSEFSSKGAGDDGKVFEANEEAMGVVLHKDSKWSQQWKEFKDNNLVFNRFFEMKMKYDESENSLVRASRAVTERMTDIIGGLFSKTEMSEVLTEILKADPSFDKDSFLKQCERDIIPNILEAMIRGELVVLKDWCYEATYSQLAHPIQQAKAMGLHFHSKILDIDNIDLAMGKMMDQGPVLIITFQAQLVMVIRNTKGEVVEGDPEKVLRMMYVWALCRDQEELNPYAAWRLLDISASSTEQIL
ncbi:mitochondrial import inner membrane translocase subunit TIM44 isoform X3 [Anarrhichthys ocellatus]|uniref:mitochondrial import inner membrane translocase subunit TIM44 isoform X3 n=1 Tax=Anarrhichthys ocellatus TaxID=433405 RepID=UPI0012ED467E|nr:mitochondrial import inner membrane translocase subunit TIM44-like isoform X3 [Anarrhichthys ocellatus]